MSDITSIEFYSPIFVVSLLGFLLLPDKYIIEKITLPFTFFLLLAELCSIGTVGHLQYGPRYLLPSMPFVMEGLSGFFIIDNKSYLSILESSGFLPIFIILIGMVSIIICTMGSIFGVMYRPIHNHAFPYYFRRLISHEVPVFQFIYLGLFLPLSCRIR